MSRVQVKWVRRTLTSSAPKTMSLSYAINSNSFTSLNFDDGSSHRFECMCLWCEEASTSEWLQIEWKSVSDFVNRRHDDGSHVISFHQHNVNILIEASWSGYFTISASAVMNNCNIRTQTISILGNWKCFRTKRVHRGKKCVHSSLQQSAPDWNGSEVKWAVG